MSMYFVTFFHSCPLIVCKQRHAWDGPCTTSSKSNISSLLNKFRNHVHIRQPLSSWSSLWPLGAWNFSVWNRHVYVYTGLNPWVSQGSSHLLSFILWSFIYTKETFAKYPAQGTLLEYQLIWIGTLPMWCPTYLFLISYCGLIWTPDCYCQSNPASQTRVSTPLLHIGPSPSLCKCSHLTGRDNGISQSITSKHLQ